jgi:hypothetical protein
MNARPRVSTLFACLAFVSFADHSSAQQQHPERDAMKASVAHYKLLGQVDLDRLVQVRTRDGLLDVTVDADPEGTGYNRIDVPGSDATWVVNRRAVRVVGAAAPNSYLYLTRYDFDAPDDQPWRSSVTVGPKTVTFASYAGEGRDQVAIRLTQSGGTLRFSVSSVNPAGVRVTPVNLAATSLAQLQSEHPDEVRKHLAPLLRALTGRSLFRHGAADVYRIFESIPADQAVARKLEELLVRLDGDAFAVRDKATAELAALGPAGVLAALRRDNNDLAPEARNRVLHFLAAHSTLTPADVARARADRSFLIDCLDDDDPAVRAAARAQLEKLLARPIPFDPSLTGKARQAAIEQLRATFAPPPPSPPRPAVQPK